MNKRILFTLFFAVSLLLASAQQGWKFHPSMMTGFTAGQLGTGAQLKANLAFTHGPWSIGPGAAIDYYRFRTIPIFASITRDLSSSKSSTVFFIYGEAGVDLPWYYPDTHPYDYYSTKYRPASWYSAGPGLRVRLSPHHPQTFLLTAGYTNKNVKETQTSQYPCVNPTSCAFRPDSYKYTWINRLLAFSIGLRF